MSVYIITIAILSILTLSYLQKESAKFWTAQKNMMKFLKSISEFNEDNWQIFLEYSDLMNRHGFHKSHAKGFVEVKSFIKGKFNIEV